MQFEQYAILSLLVIILALFIWGKWRYDIVAIFSLLSAYLLGLISEDEIFTGFGHPATITVAIVLILSYGLTRSGAIEGLTKLIEPVAKIPSLHIAALIFIAAFLSMFMNNVGALALLMPVAIQSTLKANRSPSTVLMPLSFGSILGGLVTLIGTPPNIIISSYREQIMGEPFHMFDFAPVGAPIALIGIIFMAAIGWRFVKTRKTTANLDLFEIDSYLFEIKVPEASHLVGKTIHELQDLLNEHDINLLSLFHYKQSYSSPPKKHKLIANDIIIVEGAHDDIDKIVATNNLEITSADSNKDALFEATETTAMEVVVGASSKLVGKTVADIRFRTNHNVNLLAISRQGQSIRGRLRSQKIQVGDVLLLYGEKEHVEYIISKIGCFPLSERGVDFGKRKMGIIALITFAAAIATSSLGLAPLQVSLGVAVLVMVLINVIPVRELYDGIDWSVIVLLGAMIPVGSALEETGTTKLLADGLLGIAGDIPLLVILILVLVITMTLSDILNNAATAILMAPIGKDIAESAGANPDSFLMAIAIGASCAFLTPIGHQNNALVMGPGGYRFGDYWRVGLPLEILIILFAIPLILLFWPLYPA